MTYNLCIIGAGMFGSAAARHASEDKSLKVCLVGPSEPSEEDRKKRSIFSCHYDEGRITRVLDEDTSCQIMAKCSINRYKDLEKSSGIKFYHPVGSLFILYKHSSYLKKTLKAAKGNHIPLIELSCKEEFNKRYPFLRLKDDEIALVDNNGGGHISPRKMVEAQKKVAKLQGCDIYDSVVSQIKLLDNGLYEVKIETEQDFKEKNSTSNSIISEKVLIATGSYVNATKFEILQPLKVKTYKRTVTLVKISEDEANRLSQMPSIVYKGENTSAYILPPIKYPDGHYYLKIGCYGKDIEVEKLQEMKEWYLSNGEEELVRKGLNMLTEMIPGLKYESVISDTCINCYTPTTLPYIDQISPNITVAVAGNGKGAKFSDEVGRLAANLSIRGTWDTDLQRSHFKAIFS